MKASFTCLGIALMQCFCCQVGFAQNNGGKSRVVQLSGGLNAYAGLYKSTGIAGRNQPNPFGLSGAITVSLPGGITLPFSVILGNQSTSFRQPFNQFGISPTYKWATVHAGYRNVAFSPFTLAGHTFLGGGVELNPGLFRIGVVYGRFNKAISSTIADPDITPSFKRTGYAFKVGYGKPNNYIDLLVLRAKDDTNSISGVVSTPEQNIAPAENLVVGISSRLLLVKHISLEVDAAASSYTRDMYASAVGAEGSNFLAKLFGKMITPRLSTQLTQATQAALGYQSQWGMVKFQYKRIDPNFQTMGAYYFQSDIQSYTGNVSLNLLKSKIRLAGSYGRQFDNLGKNKNAGTGRSIGSLMVSVNPDPTVGVDISLSNYGLSQRAGLRPLIDTLRIAQNNFSTTVNMRYAIFNKELSHIFTLTGSHQRLSDLNNATAMQTENSNQNASLGYFLQQNQSGFGMNLMVSYTQTGLPVTGQGPDKLRFYGPTLGSNYSFFKKKIVTSANVSYLINQQAAMTGKVLTAIANAGYQLSKRQNLSIVSITLNRTQGCRPRSSTNSEETLAMEYLSKIWQQHFFALVLLVLAFQHSGTYAQTQVRITTNVLPPYSPYIQDYPGTGNRVQVFISNLSGKELSIRLLGKLEGDNGVVIRTSPNYRPVQPLQLRATDVNRLVNRSELEGLFDLAQIEVQGMNKNELYRGIPLPEGNYQLCVQAFDNATTRPLSAEFPMGCSGLIPVRIVEPPILIMPFADEEVIAKTPQTQLFSWSAPVGVNPSQVEYTFRLIELPHPDTDPNVFIDAVVLPRSGIEIKGLRTTTLVYGPQHPPLQFGKKYAWRVQAHPLSQRLNFLNEGKSPVQGFTYGLRVKPGIEPVTVSPLLSLLDLGVEKKESKFLSADIAASCECNPVQAQQDMKVDNSKVRAEKKATIANFTIENVSVTESNGKLNGTGMIPVPMINSGYIRLIVKLMDVQCNAQGVVIAGKVRGIHKEGVPGMLPGADAPDAPSVQITPQQIQNMGEYFASSKDQLVSNLKSSVSSIGFKLPFGIDNGKNAVIAITDMIFTPKGAVFNANSWVPSPSDQISGLPLSGYNLCMTPSKPCGEGVLYLAKKMEVTKYFALKGDDDGLAGSAFLKPDTSQVTYAVFDKDGFRKMRIHGLLTPPKLKLVETNGPVEISINTDVEKDFKNWTAQFSFPRFYVEGIKDFKFSMASGQPALYDHSEAVTPGALPEGYETTDGYALWKGLYFPEMTIELPDFLKKGDGGDPVTASAKGMIYDDKGFSGKMEVENVLPIDQGSMGGWYFSIDQFMVSFLNSSFQTSQMKGALVLPIFKDPTNKSSQLDYKSTITSNASDGALAFELSAESSSDMHSDVWKAILNLKGSSIKAQYNASTGFAAKAVLNGTIGIDAGSFNIPNATFQGVILNTTAPYFQVEEFSMTLASPQKEATGLPFSIDPARTGVVDEKTATPAFRIGGDLDLSEAAGITAQGDFMLRFNVGNASNGRPEWSFKKIESAAFKAGGTVGPISVSGEVNLFEDDPTFGNGFKGNLHMTMLEKFDIEVGAMFGKITGPDPYRYWYVGGKAKLPEGASIPLAGPVVFKGFGGGLYSNVLQTASADTVIYIPEKGKKGFNASVLVGMITPDLLDGEGTFTMNLNGSTVDNINIHANAWFLGTGKNASLATGTLDLNLDLAKSVFTGKGDLTAGLEISPGSISANLPVNLEINYSGTPNWYFAIGAPTEHGRANLTVKLGIEATFGSYFVMGSYTPNGWKLPPDPYITDAALRSLFNGMSRKRKDQSSQAFKSSPENPVLAFGAGFSMGHDYNIGPFYMHFAGAVGFDMVLKKLDSPCGASGQIPGINGWYAEGQLYAGMTFALGIDVDLWVYEGRIEVASLSAGALLRGGLVNPIWLNGQVAVRYSVLKGLVKGNFNFDFWYNREHQCDPAFLPPNPFTDMPLISSIGPAGTDTKTSIMTPFTATFNYPVENKMIVEIEIPEGKQVDAGAIGTRMGNTFIQEFKLQFKDRFVAIATQKSGDSNTGTLVMGKNEEGDRNYAATYYRDKSLLPNTTYDLTVGIQVYVYNKTKLEPFLFKSKTVEQTERVSFVTADCPTDLSKGASSQDMVLSSYPYEGQRYFMKGESARPFVKLKAVPQGCLNGMGADADYDLQVAFTPLEGSQFAADQAKSVLLASAEFTGDQYVYDLPLGLRNNTLYRLQLIRIPKEEFVDQVLAKGFDGQINTKKITTANIYKSTGFSSNPASIQNTQVSPVVSGSKTQVLSGTTKPSVIQNQVDLTYGGYVNTYSDAGKMAQIANTHGLTASVDTESATSLFKLTQQGTDGLATMKDLAGKKEKLRKSLKMELYRYYFKTSKYNTLKDKIGAAKFTTASGAGVGPGIKTGDVVTGSMTVDEGFDRYDLSYEELGYGQFRPPLVLLKATENSAWFKAVAKPVATLLSEAPDQYFKDSEHQVNVNLLDGTLDTFKRSVVRFSTYFTPTEEPYDNATIYTLFPTETSH